MPSTANAVESTPASATMVLCSAPISTFGPRPGLYGRSPPLSTRVQRNPEWLAVAADLFGFLQKFGRDEAGDWNFLVSRQGEVLQGPESIQTDAYAVCGLVEYARASGLEEPLAMAYETYARTLQKLRTPGSYRTAPYPMPPGTKAQRVSMQFSLAYHELARFTGDASVLEEATRLTDDILDNFRQPQLEALLDYLSLDNKVLPAPEGTFMGPGHGIESAWFQIESLRESGDRTRIGKALDIMRWSFEKGWDPEFGGLFLGIDIEGGKPLLDHSDAKIWWPFCEALCGALLAWESSGEQWCLDWYQKTSQWAFEHFPDREHGEWKQRLDRRGQPLTRFVALPVKDPFHLPRAAIYALECAERNLQKDNTYEQSANSI